MTNKIMLSETRDDLGKSRYNVYQTLISMSFTKKYFLLKPGANRSNMLCNMLYNMSSTMFERFEHLF